MNSRSAFGALLLCLGAAASLRATTVFTLTPSGDVSGTPGSTVGWGFTIQNDTDYVEITSAQYCVNPVNFPLVCTSSALGTFTDFISQFNDIIVGPPGGTDPSSVSQNFDPIGLTGIGSFAIDNGASGGDQGQIVLTYNLTSLDPRDPNAVPRGTDLAMSANASVTVTGGSVPEPGTAAMMVVALAGFVVGRRVISRGSKARGEGTRVVADDNITLSSSKSR
jgi:hypothetical protein